MLSLGVQSGPANNNNAVVKEGEQIFVVHRPLFQGDVRRHFIGTVLAVDLPLVRTSGHVFAADAKTNQFRRHDPERVRVISLTGDSLIINVIPSTVRVESITYQYRPGPAVVLTDGSGWHLDVTHL